MATRFSIEAVFKAIDGMTAPIRKMTIGNKKFVRSLKNDFANAQRSVLGFGNILKNAAAIGITAIGIGLSAAMVQGIKLASDLAEVQNVVDVTFQKSSNQINEWSKSALDAFGLSELQAKKFNGTLGALLKSSGITGDNLLKMSTDLTGLTGDFASFYNLDHEEAFNKIRSGISGETEPLKQLGINMSVANLEAFALSKGITKSWKSMTQAEQVLLRYNYIMKASKDAQGDFQRTSQGFANQQRILITRFQMLSANIMKQVLPALTDGMIAMNKFISNIDGEKIGKQILNVVNFLVKFGKIMVQVVKVITPFAPIILGITAAIMAYKAGLLIAAAAQWVMNVAMTANPVGIIIVAIGALIGIVILLVIHWKTITKFIIESYEKFKIFIAIFLPWLVVLIEVIKLLVKNWEKIKKTAIDVFTSVVKFMKPVIDNFAKFNPIIQILASIISKWDQIKKGFEDGGILGGILAIGKAILDGILSPIQSFLALVSKIPGVGNLAKGGNEIIENLRAGLNSPNAPISPAERSQLIKKETTERGEITIKDKTGKAEMTKNPKGKNYNLKLQKSGAF